MTNSAVPLSVLDLAIVGQGQTSADALAASTRVAQQAETLGYTRFWVAEHHNMPAVASTAPSVLAAHVAAHTTGIKVGSGGVMLPNHPPLVVAEQFAMLEAMHPGRIDLGIGRAPGTDPSTAAALRRGPGGLGAEEFPEHLAQVMAMLGHPAAPPAPRSFSATPNPTGWPDILLLGSSGFSARLAGQLGLPFAFAHHFAGDNTMAAAELYRRAFRPSAAAEAPYLIVTASVIAAKTEDEARWFARPSQLMILGLRTGQLAPLPTPEVAATDPRRDAAAALPSTQIVGEPDHVCRELQTLVADTGAHELMISTTTHGVDERLESLSLLAQAWPVDDGRSGSTPSPGSLTSRPAAEQG